MKDLRQRCDELYERIFGIKPNHVSDKNDMSAIESFAQEIRNEALEGAAMHVCECYNDCSDTIRALKTDALTATGKEE